MKGVSDQLNNDIIDTKNDIENESPVAVTVPDEAEDVSSPVIQDAFDYQPPSVEAPEPKLRLLRKQPKLPRSLPLLIHISLFSSPFSSRRPRASHTSIISMLLSIPRL